MKKYLEYPGRRLNLPGFILSWAGLFLGVIILSTALLALSGCESVKNNGQAEGQLAADSTEMTGDIIPPGRYSAAQFRNYYELPLEFYGMNLMVNAVMNGKKIKMLIDNGVLWDELLFYGSPLVDSLNIKQDGKILVTGAGEGDGVSSGTASNLSIDFGELHFTGQKAVITSKESGFAEYFPGIAGQVCGAFFKHFIVEFNFDDNLLKLHRVKGYVYKGWGNFVEMIKDSSGAYKIPVTLKLNGKQRKCFLFIDLGGIYQLSLPVGGEYGFDKPSSPKIYLGEGASGAINGYRGSVENLRIAGFNVRDVRAVFVEAPKGGNHTNTTIGLALLKKFNLVFDYFHRKLYLEPNSHFKEIKSDDRE